MNKTYTDIRCPHCGHIQSSRWLRCKSCGKDVGKFAHQIQPDWVMKSSVMGGPYGKNYVQANYDIQHAFDILRDAFTPRGNMPPERQAEATMMMNIFSLLENCYRLGRSILCRNYMRAQKAKEEGNG